VVLVNGADSSSRSANATAVHDEVEAAEFLFKRS
jgi:hypothetical protein